MSNIGQIERLTQNRVVRLFTQELKYTYLGNWEDRPDNSNIEEELLTNYLSKKGYSPTHITRALHKLRVTASNYNESLYLNNKNVYKLLRYGVPVKAEAGENFETVQLINWQDPEKNDFGIAEEVTVQGIREKRPDIVLYVNGIAIGVLELKRSTVSIGDGIRQSIVLVLLAKWILENNPDVRVAIITDRDELDKQIERVFNDAGEPIKRTASGRDLMAQLSEAKPRLLCSLVHKFGKRDVDNFEEFINELESRPTQVVGELFLFVDECHRTQSGKLHRTMKAMLPSAVFIGFTGTPLLKKDRQTSLEVFGKYIHTYKLYEVLGDEKEVERIFSVIKKQSEY